MRDIFDTLHDHFARAQADHDRRSTRGVDDDEDLCRYCERTLCAACGEARRDHDEDGDNLVEVDASGDVVPAPPSCPFVEPRGCCASCAAEIMAEYLADDE